MSKHVVVVGGGIIGLSSAWYLQQAGWNVTVLDQAKIGAACSGGNCGLICPSHVLPLTEPGAFKNALQAMTSGGGAFSIKLRLDPALWSWLWNFSRRCNTRDMLQAAEAIQTLLHSAMNEYQEWMRTGLFECEWQEEGLLFVYKSKAAWEAYRETNKLLASDFDEPADMLDRDATLELEPALKDSVAGSWLYQGDAHLRPDRLVASIVSRLREAGTEFREQTKFEGLEGSQRQVRKVLTSEGAIAAEQVVLAAGAWSPKLQSWIGANIPIQPGKGYSLTMPRPKICPRVPMIFPEHRVAVTPMQTGYRLGSIMEFSGYDESIKETRLDLLRQGARHYLKEPLAEPEQDRWFGWRPMTYDSVPIIDRTPRWENVWLATGHNMLGLSMAPATGRLVAELVDGRPSHVPTNPYRIGRF